MRKLCSNVFWLGHKELQSLRADVVLWALIVYVFTVGVYSVSTGVRFEVDNASIAVVDEDRSQLSQRLVDVLQPPYFKPPVLIDAADMDRAMDLGRYIFVIEIPAQFEADVLKYRQPSIQINVDATAMSQAGNGAMYLQTIINRELNHYLQKYDQAVPLPVNVVVRALFNPNLNSQWFMAVMQIINNITILSLILSGAAFIREREQQTLEHLMVMPLTPLEIMLAKVGANGLVILIAALLSLLLIVRGILQVPVQGSVALFIGGAILYQFSITALGILLATFTRSMPQFGLLVLPIFVIMNLLSGSSTPLESMPLWLQNIMQFSPSTHFVSFSQAVLYRDAGFAVVWPQLLALLVSGVVFFTASLRRFRRVIVQSS